MFEINRNEEKVILIIIITILCITFAVRFIAFKPADVKVIKENNEDEITESIEKPDKIYVYVTGEVKNPGVYELEYGDRINELINAAGGFTEKADTISVNLAEKLEDEQHVNILSKEDASQSQSGQIIKSSISGGKININIASAKELADFLPGIGEVYANNIVAYREKNGKFKSVEEITRVSGIGQKRFESIKDLITVN